MGSTVITRRAATLLACTTLLPALAQRASAAPAQPDAAAHEAAVLPAAWQARWQVLAAQVEAMRARHGVTALLVGFAHGDGAPLVAAAGTSMTGVPARIDMHFRMGAMAIGALTTILMQLVDEGRLSLEDTIDRWLPDYPQAGRVSLRMLADCTSGYADYESDPAFVDAFHKDVFRAWSTAELLDIAFKRGMVFTPGSAFQYAHTNFIVLAQALAKATGTAYETLLQQRILDRIGLSQTQIWTDAELPAPSLHSFTTERGVFEDATYWSPSWTSYTGPLNGDMGDTVRLMRALATGRTVSKESLRLLLTAETIGKGGNRPDRAFSLGLELLPPWVQKTFAFGGYGGTAGHMSAQNVTLAVATTLGAQSDPDNNPSTPIFHEIAARLLP